MEKETEKGMVKVQDTTNAITPRKEKSNNSPAFCIPGHCVRVAP
jgi:hypothetical protein